MANERIRITLSEDWSWTKRLLTFSGIFGGMWLFLEPFFAIFGGSGPLSSLGIWRYFILVIIAGILAIAVEAIDRRQVVGKINFIPFTIIMVESGVRHDVEAPEDMKTEDFVNLFLEKVSKNASPKTALAHSDMYTNFLMIKANDMTWLPALSSRTLKENGIEPENEYRIEGKIKKARERVHYRLRRR